MRFLLDAHVSGPRIGASLSAEGHDVLAVDQERDLEGWSDQELLALATAEGRILVTFDVGDFTRIAQSWAGERRSHAGVVLLVRLGHSEFGAILDAIRRGLDLRPSHEAWRDQVVFVGRDR